MCVGYCVYRSDGVNCCIGEVFDQSKINFTSTSITSVMIIIAGASLSEQHTDLLICRCTKQDLSRTSRS